MDTNAKKALKQVKMEIAAEYEIHPEHIFSLIEFGYDKFVIDERKLLYELFTDRKSNRKRDHGFPRQSDG